MMAYAWAYLTSGLLLLSVLLASGDAERHLRNAMAQAPPAHRREVGVGFVVVYPLAILLFWPIRLFFLLKGATPWRRD